MFNAKNIYIQSPPTFQNYIQKKKKKVELKVATYLNKKNKKINTKNIYNDGKKKKTFLEV